MIFNCEECIFIYVHGESDPVFYGKTMFADHSLIFATSPPKLENLVEITLKKPKFQVENKWIFAQKKTLVLLISPNLAKLSYGLSPLQLHHKIDKIDPKKKKKKPWIFNKNKISWVLWKGALAIGGETGAAMAIVTIALMRRDHPKL